MTHEDGGAPSSRMLARMFVERRGRGTPILFVHGAAIDHRALLPLDAAFDEAAPWQRVFVDLPGHGRTPADPALDGSDAVADVLARFVDAQFGRGPFALVGESWGGLLCRALAARYARRLLGLCLIAPVAVAARERRVLPPRTVVRDDPELMRALSPADRRDYAELSVVRGRENWELFRAFVQPSFRVFDEDAGRRIDAHYELAADPEAGPPLACPTLILTGRQDSSVGWRDQAALLAHYPRATFAVLDGAGHNLQLDRLRATLALLRDWLTRMRPDEGAR